MRSWFIGLVLLLPGSGAAEPVDFLDPTPRWIEVAFEVSPRDKPAQTDTIYTPKIPARLEPGDQPARIQVTIDRRHVERVLLADDDPVPGSFSDYVWVFDAVTGEVISASLSGVLMKELDLGLFRSKVRAKIAADMSTHRMGGFKKPRHWMGQQVFRFCDGTGLQPCNFVAANGYDSSSGYVNAVGDLSVRFGELELRTFCPLGEAVFSEVSPQGETASARSDPSLGAGAIAAPEWSSMPAVSAGPPAAN
jgi:hypothetical protein